MSYKTNKGFTLIEILIALFIFTIISMIMVSALHTVFSTQSSTEKSAARLADLQIALTFIERDFEQAIQRPITSPNGGQELAFVGTPTSATFTHAGLDNPSGQLKRSTLQRVRYHMEKEKFYRDTWAVLDQTQQSQADQRRLLTGVTELSFEYLDQEGHFQTRWPPANQNDNANLPRAVQISLTLANWGKLTQLYLIPGQKFDKPK